MKQAIGLAFSGREVRLAHLVAHKGTIRVLGLETGVLRTPLDYQYEEVERRKKKEQDSKDVFGLREDSDESDPRDQRLKSHSANIEELYKLIFKHVDSRVKVGMNLPISMTNYQRVTSDDPRLLESIVAQKGESNGEVLLNIGHRVLPAADGSKLVLTYEENAKIISVIDEVNEFVTKKLYFGLLDTTELTLLNLARTRRDIAANQVSVIIYVEEEFTRLIFLHSRMLLHASAIIHENAASPLIAEVIARKLIYEQDEAQIPEISKIWLAGQCARIGLHHFFQRHFKNASVEYLDAPAIGKFPIEGKHDEICSEYAVAIGLAWKLLDPKDPNMVPINLLPQRIRDAQDVLKLDYYGLALLAVTAVLTFMLTWRVLDTHKRARYVALQNVRYELLISNHQNKIDEILDLEQENNQFENSLKLVEDLSQNYDEALIFLKKLNRSIREAGGVWINEITRHDNGYAVRGTSLTREKIPLFAEMLWGANLNKVTRESAGATRVYQFDLDRIQVPEDERRKELQPEVRPGNRVPSLTGKDVASTAQGLTPPPLAAGLSAPVGKVVDNAAAPSDMAAAETADDREPSRRRTEEAGAGQAPMALQAGEKASPGPSQPEDESVAAPNRGRVAASSALLAASDPSLFFGPMLPAGEKPAAGGARAAAGPSRPRAANQQKLVGAATAGKAPEAAPAKAATAQEMTTPPANGTPPADTAPAPSGPAAPLLRPQPPGNPPYAIVLAKAYSQDYAEQYAVIYRGKGLDPKIEPYYDEENKLLYGYRILIGPYAKYEAAVEAADNLLGPLPASDKIISLAAQSAKAGHRN